MLKATDLCFRYGSFELKNIDLTIEKGTFTCIAGSNGSGKSTLARLLGGVLEPTSGTIERSSLCGLVLSNPDNMFVNQTVEEDVAFGPENLGHTSEQIREDVDRALEMTALTDYANEKISSLSYGLKQRVAIAGALAMDADYLILDEVTSMLDTESSEKILSLILDLVSKGKAVVLVTHNMDHAVYADSLAIMDKGNVIANDIPWKILNNRELMNRCALRQPYTVRIADKLRLKGYGISAQSITPDALEKEIRRCSDAYIR